MRNHEVSVFYVFMSNVCSILITLKIVDYIDWPWFVVLLPVLGIPIGFVLFVLVLLVLIFIYDGCIKVWTHFKK